MKVKPNNKSETKNKSSNSHPFVSSKNGADFLSVNIQPKLKVKPQNDAYEQEADRVALTVKDGKKSDGAPPKISKISSPSVQFKCKACQEREKEEAITGIKKPAKKCKECEEGAIQMKGGNTTETTSSIDNKIQDRKGQGSPMANNVRKEMGQKFNANFDDVRIHSDPDSSQLNEELGSKAFTQGNDIFFNSGEFNPGTDEGKELLAHELTHTIQQGAVNQEEGADQSASGEVSTPAKKAESNKPSNEQTGEKGRGKVEKRTAKDVKTVGEKTGITEGMKNPLEEKLEQKKPEKEIKLPEGALKKKDKAEDEEPNIPGLKAPLVKEKKGEKGEEEEEEEKKEEPKPPTLEEQLAMAQVSADEAKINMITQEFQVASLGSSAPQFKAPELEEGDPQAEEAIKNTNKGNELVRSLYQNASGSISRIYSVGHNIRPQLSAIAEQNKSLIDLQVLTQQKVVSTQISKLKKGARGSTYATIGVINAMHSKTVGDIEARYTSSKKTIDKAKEEAVKLMGKHKLAQFPKLNKIYRDAVKNYKQAGVNAGNYAVRRANSKANDYMSGYWGKSDGMFDTPYVGRARARYDTAKNVGKEYKKGLIKEGEKQADELMKGEGRKKDYKAVDDIEKQTIESLEKQYDATIKSLDQAKEQLTKEAKKLKKQLIRGARTSLKGTLDLLDQQEEAQLKMLEAFGARQKMAIDRDALNAYASLENGITGAGKKLLDALATIRGLVEGQEVPDPEALAMVLVQVELDIAMSVEGVIANTDMAVATTTESMNKRGAEAIAGTESLALKGLEEAKTIQGQLFPVLSNLKKSAKKGFEQLGKSGLETIKKITDSSTTGFRAIADGINATFAQFNTNTTKNLAASSKQVEGALKEAVDNDLYGVIHKHAEEAASKVQPRWKKFAKILLAVVVILVVAFVVGPAVIGFVAGAATALGAGAAAGTIGAIVGGAIVGAAAGAVMQMGNNLIDGKPIMEGVGKAVVVGAIGGALGGAGGALGQMLTKGASGVVLPALSRFGIDFAFDVAGGILGDIATTGTFSVESALLGAAIGGGISIGMGSFGALKGLKVGNAGKVGDVGNVGVPSKVGKFAGKVGDFAGKIEGFQAGMMSKGEGLGKAFGSSVKSTFSGKVDVPTTPKTDISSPKVDTPPVKVEPTTPKVDTSTPKVETNTPKVEPNAPKVDTNAPKVDTSSPKVDNANTKSPKAEDGTSPKPKQDSPEERVVNPKKAKENNQLTPEDIASEQQFIKANQGKIRESSIPGYTKEIELPNGHVWREGPNGGWCRFSDKPHPVVVPVQSLDALMQLDNGRTISIPGDRLFTGGDFGPGLIQMENDLRAEAIDRKVTRVKPGGKLSGRNLVAGQVGFVILDADGMPRLAVARPSDVRGFSSGRISSLDGVMGIGQATAGKFDIRSGAEDAQNRQQTKNLVTSESVARGKTGAFAFRDFHSERAFYRYIRQNPDKFVDAIERFARDNNIKNPRVKAMIVDVMSTRMFCTNCAAEGQRFVMQDAPDSLRAVLGDEFRQRGNIALDADLRTMFRGAGDVPFGSIKPEMAGSPKQIIANGPNENLGGRIAITTQESIEKQKIITDTSAAERLVPSLCGVK